MLGSSRERFCDGWTVRPDARKPEQRPHLQIGKQPNDGTRSVVLALNEPFEIPKHRVIDA